MTDEPRPQVLCVHGFASSADSLIINQPDRAFPYFLADNGYDVWLINLRGNNYSRAHTNLDPDVDEGFWDFDMTDFSQDIMTTIEYVLENSEQQTLSVVAFSVGNAPNLILASIEPEWYVDHVDILVLINPAIKLTNIENCQFKDLTNPVYIQIASELGVTEIMTPTFTQHTLNDLL